MLDKITNGWDGGKTLWSHFAYFLVQLKLEIGNCTSNAQFDPKGDFKTGAFSTLYSTLAKL